MPTSTHLESLNALRAAAAAAWDNGSRNNEAAFEAELERLDRMIEEEAAALQAYDRTERAERYENARWRSNPNR